jgi:hypothetical protein
MRFDLFNSAGSDRRPANDKSVPGTHESHTRAETNISIHSRSPGEDGGRGHPKQPHSRRSGTRGQCQFIPDVTVPESRENIPDQLDSLSDKTEVAAREHCEEPTSHKVLAIAGN